MTLEVVDKCESHTSHRELWVNLEENLSHEIADLDPVDFVIVILRLTGDCRYLRPPLAAIVLREALSRATGPD